METSLYPARQRALRGLMADKNLEALLVAGPENRRYLSGFTARDELLTETSGWLLVAPEGGWLLTDFRYQEWAAREAAGFEVVVYRESLGAALLELVKGRGLGRVGFEAAYLSWRAHQRLTQAAAEGGLEVEWAPTEGLVEELREVKAPEEEAAIQAALELTEAVFQEVAALLRPGMTERQAAWEIERRLREAGADALAFNSIVAAGNNSALPHHRPGDAALKAGEPVIIDMGARINGYCDDFTRTLCLEEPTARFKEVYALVRRAQARAEAGLKDGHGEPVHSRQAPTPISTRTRTPRVPSARAIGRRAGRCSRRTRGAAPTAPTSTARRTVPPRPTRSGRPSARGTPACAAR